MALRTFHTTFVVVFLLLIIVTVASSSQYIPFSMPSSIPVVDLTDKTYPYRTNWCPTRAAVLNGTMSYAFSLRDRTVYLSADPGFQGGPGNDAEFWKIKYDSTGYPVSGLMYNIWTALSIKLGNLPIHLLTPPYPLSTIIRNAYPLIPVNPSSYPTSSSSPINALSPLIIQIIIRNTYPLIPPSLLSLSTQGLTYNGSTSMVKLPLPPHRSPIPSSMLTCMPVE